MQGGKQARSSDQSLLQSHRGQEGLRGEDRGSEFAAGSCESSGVLQGGRRVPSLRVLHEDEGVWRSRDSLQFCDKEQEKHGCGNRCC